jgi:hypothetical protein
MDDKISRLETCQSWKYVDSPAGANVIDCKWVFRTKRNEHRKEIVQRSRLVARGDTQVHRVDYQANNTFASVAKMASVRSILALAAKAGYVIHQVDVNSAYFYGQLEEGKEIFMKPLKGINLKSIKPSQVLRLWACLYGLKQAGHQ